MLGRRGGDLSGGQQQQLAIGRALVMRPKLLLLDEPTEGIQPSIIKDIGRAISYLRSLGNMAIVLVEQYLDFACELGDNFAVMDRGAVKYACDRSQSRSRRDQPPDGAVRPYRGAISRLGDGCGPIFRARLQRHSRPTGPRARCGSACVCRTASPAAAILHESGSLRVRFPSPEAEGLSGVFVNTAGGIAGGDRFDIDIAAGEGSRLTLTTAAAEKVYRAAGPAAQLNIALEGGGGRAPRLAAAGDHPVRPGADRQRRIDIDLAADASLLLCEIVVFGRAAMGEKMLHGEFVDRWRLRRGGRLVFAETVRLDGDIGEKLARPAVANGGVAIGTALIVPGDEALVERIREASETFGGEVGISAWNGFAMARFCAQDAARLRADMMAVLGRASGVALPRLWLN